MTIRKPKKPKTLTAAQADQLYARIAAERPDPKSDLEYVNAYTLLVAVVLSAQATDLGVNEATGPLFASVRDAAAMVDFGEDRLAQAIRTIGLYKTKARNVMALSRILLEKHGGQVPDDRAALEALPGVGRKTANVVLNIAFGHPTIAVDTHCFRLGNRTGLAPGKNVQEVEEGLLKITPERWGRDAHHYLILHGRYVCKARKPECERCCIHDLCLFDAKTV